MRQPPARLFQLGAGSDAAAPGWSRWGAAAVIAGLVHLGLLGGMLAVRPAARAPAQADAPELVLYAYAPPPPAAAAGPAAAAPRHVQARTSRPVVAKRAPVLQPRAPEAPVEPPAPAPAVEAAPALAQVAVASTGVAAGSGTGIAGGAEGGVTGGQLGGMAGAPLQLKQVKQRPQLLVQLELKYPRQARADGIAGTVLVSFIIGTDGRVEAQHTRVLRSIPALDAAAVEAVNRLRFSPGVGGDGRPVRVIATQPIDFSLR